MKSNGVEWNSCQEPKSTKDNRRSGTQVYATCEGMSLRLTYSLIIPLPEWENLSLNMIPAISLFRIFLKKLHFLYSKYTWLMNCLNTIYIVVLSTATYWWRNRLHIQHSLTVSYFQMKQRRCYIYRFLATAVDINPIQITCEWMRFTLGIPENHRPGRFC